MFSFGIKTKLLSKQENVENSTTFNFYFDGKLIPLTSDHKHLGITFSEEAKWNKHVENLI
jgi:hypothetical protein